MVKPAPKPKLQAKAKPKATPPPKPPTTYEWDPESAARKFVMGSHVTVGVPATVAIERDLPPHNPQTDAYQCCRNCGKHKNYHTNGVCPK